MTFPSKDFYQPLDGLPEELTVSIVLGRGSASVGSAQQLSLGPSLKITGTTLDVAASVTSMARTFMLMGA